MAYCKMAERLLGRFTAETSHNGIILDNCHVEGKEEEAWRRVMAEEQPQSITEVQ